MFLVELVAFLIIWPIMWWLGGRLADDGIAVEPKRQLPDNVIDLAQFRRRHTTGRRSTRR